MQVQFLLQVIPRLHLFTSFCLLLILMFCHFKVSLSDRCSRRKTSALTQSLFYTWDPMTYLGDHQTRPCFGTFRISSNASGIRNQRDTPPSLEVFHEAGISYQERPDTVIPYRLQPKSPLSQPPIGYHFKDIPPAAFHRVHLFHDPLTDQAGTSEQRWTAFK